ncbi:MAG: hypothetical protein PVI01_19160, partial [Gemmatimonadales bacterium]
MPTEPFIKICGVRDRAVLRAAVEAGATALGFNFVESSRRYLGLERARALLDWARQHHESLPTLV